jgi:hypothetical protein
MSLTFAYCEQFSRWLAKTAGIALGLEKELNAKGKIFSLVLNCRCDRE